MTCNDLRNRTTDYESEGRKFESCRAHHVQRPISRRFQADPLLSPALTRRAPACAVRAVRREATPKEGTRRTQRPAHVLEALGAIGGAR